MTLPQTTGSCNQHEPTDGANVTENQTDYRYNFEPVSIRSPTNANSSLSVQSAIHDITNLRTYMNRRRPQRWSTCSPAQLTVSV